MNNLKYQKPEAQDQESLFSMLNPVALAKYQYASPWALMTYNTARTTGKFGWNPLLFEFGNRNANTIGGKVGAALGGRYTSYEPDTNLANLFKKSGISANKNDQMFVNQMKKSIRKHAAIHKFDKFAENELRESLGKLGIWDSMKSAGAITGDMNAIKVSKVAMPGTGYYPRSKVVNLRGEKFITGLTKYSNRTMAFMRFGSAAFNITAGVQIGQLLASTATLAFKGAVSAAEYVRTKTEGMRNLEFGGSLGVGYLMSAAVTERQRAMRELQRTPINASTFMGNEASTYSTI